MEYAKLSVTATTRFLFQLRKLDIVIVFSAEMLDLIDKREMYDHTILHLHHAGRMFRIRDLVRNPLMQTTTRIVLQDAYRNQPDEACLEDAKDAREQLEDFRWNMIDYLRYQKRRQIEEEREQIEAEAQAEEIEKQTAFVMPRMIDRVRGHWIVAPQGMGKTQLMQLMLTHDLDLVAMGQASIIILDPTGDMQGTLIYNLTRLKRFAPGGDLHGKLVIIDPTIPEFTTPVNLMSLRAADNDEEAISSAIDGYISIMGGLMGQKLTSFQEPVFRYAVQAALAFPDPSLQTLREIIQPKSTLYKQVLHKLDPEVQAYFTDSFNEGGALRGRGEIMQRLHNLSADPKFRRLFRSNKSLIDFDAEINQPKVIVINASRGYLESLTSLYGRFWFSLITQAGKMRGRRDRDSLLPCLIYVDECDEFLKTDENASTILAKMRGNKMALIFGNQATKQIEEPIRSSFLGTGIKHVNADSDSARFLSTDMKCPKDWGERLSGLPTLTFAQFVSGKSNSPKAVKVPAGVMEALPKMTDGEYLELRAAITEKYCVPTFTEAKAEPVSTAERGEFGQL